MGEAYAELTRQILRGYIPSRKDALRLAFYGDLQQLRDCNQAISLLER